MQQANHFDVVIIGGGIAGLSVACALADSDLSVAVVDLNDLHQSTSYTPRSSVHDYTPRVSAITPANQQWLQALGVDTSLWHSGDYSSMCVWDGSGTGRIEFDAAETSLDELGCIAENVFIVDHLVKRLQYATNVALLSSAKVIGMQQVDVEIKAKQSVPPQYTQITLENGKQLSATLLVGADGALSRVREHFQFDMRTWPYHHHAIVATVKTELQHQQTAWQVFLPQGPLAFLPLLDESNSSQQFCSIVWSTNTDHAKTLMAMNDESFCRELERAFEKKLGDVLDISKRFSFPLVQRHAKQYVKPGIALVGDAAHTIHPLAGQGVNLGLYDAKVLSEELLRAKQRGVDIASMYTLGRYQRRRKAHNLMMMVSVEGFKRTYEAKALPVLWARNAGMAVINQQSLLKRWLINQAAGL